jgi:hypothetical protein
LRSQIRLTFKPHILTEGKIMKGLVLPSFALVVCLKSSLTVAAADLVFFGNLHSHTSYSDGSGTPSEAYTQAWDTAIRLLSLGTGANLSFVAGRTLDWGLAQ